MGDPREWLKYNVVGDLAYGAMVSLQEISLFAFLTRRDLSGLCSVSIRYGSPWRPWLASSSLLFYSLSLRGVENFGLVMLMHGYRRR